MISTPPRPAPPIFRTFMCHVIVEGRSEMRTVRALSMELAAVKLCGEGFARIESLIEQDRP